MTKKACVAGALAVCAVVAASGVEIELAWTLKNGKTEIERVQVAEKDGVTAFALPRAAIRAKGAKRLAVTPDFATAKVGDAGYWVVPTGQ